MFKDRRDAGKRLGKALKEYKNKRALVLAIPRGGTEVGFQVAKYLNGEFSLLISRKLPYPTNPEAGFGAIAEDGSIFISKDAAKFLSKKEIEEIKKEQIKEIKRRIEVLRNGKKLPEISGRIVILIDDGLAMGSTMKASITLCKKKKAKKIVVAAPIAGIDVFEEFEKIADKTVILEKPQVFRAVADAYENWYDVSDEEVIRIMNEWEKKGI
ncbi:MAG: phosphoribosyltransferase [Nanoarchaeota archaeon]|nr:phosphoribosyltransferase [Nanoarchaeota archaeon]